MEEYGFLRYNPSQPNFTFGNIGPNTQVPSIDIDGVFNPSSINLSDGLDQRWNNTGIGSKYDRIKALNSSNSGNRFGFDKGTISAIGTGMQGLSGLLGAYMNYKNYNMAKDQFNFEKNITNRNIANQATLINNRLAAAANVAAQMSAPTTANAEERARIREQFLADARTQYVDGSKVG